MAVNMSVANAAANGDLETLRELIKRSNTDVNERSVEGMRPLCIAAFWGYADVVHELLRAGADINATNTGTMWTALHCACFQGHGKVVMKLMDRQPDITLKDNQGRTAIDFASAQDSVWSFFAVAGCKRTLKSELVTMNIVRKLSEDPSAAIKPYGQPHVTRLSRPGSAYVMATQSLCHQNTRLDDRQERQEALPDEGAGARGRDPATHVVNDVQSLADTVHCHDTPPDEAYLMIY